METEVFNQPGVGTALQVNYVPVKINADLMPSTARQYGISACQPKLLLLLKAKWSTLSADEPKPRN